MNGLNVNDSQRQSFMNGVYFLSTNTNVQRQQQAANILEKLFTKWIAEIDI